MSHALFASQQRRADARGPDAVWSSRAAVLLGDAPLLTFAADEAAPQHCLSVRLRRAVACYVGIVDDGSQFLDGIRLGMSPRFVVHHEGSTPTMCGEAEVRILCRVDGAGALSAAVDPALAAAVAQVLRAGPRGRCGGVVIAVQPRALSIDEGDAPAHGAVPRT